MTSYAGAIAAKLQGAHERRQRHEQQRGEDEDMAEPIINEDTNPELRVIREVGEQFDRLRARIAELEVQAPQASAVSAERVVELERQLTHAKFNLGEIRRERDEARELLATTYVAREVPWTDVAAGMMTLSREDHPRPWMVVGVSAGVWMLQNGEQRFGKTPAEGETVRVLEPYVTPEQAETLVASELGGRA